MKKLACTLLLLSSALVQAGFDEGLVAADKGDYQTAFKEWKPLAEQGDASAQYNLGNMYGKGQGVPQNFKIAYILFNLAASNSGADATQNRDIAAAKLSPATIEDAQRITLQLHNSKNFAADLRNFLNSQK